MRARVQLGFAVLLTVLAAILGITYAAPVPQRIYLPVQTLSAALPAGDPSLTFGSFTAQEPQLAVASADRVEVFRVAAPGRLVSLAGWSTEGPIAAILGIDVDADGKDEIVTITADDGVIETSKLGGGVRVPVGERRYLWGAVNSAVVAKTAEGPLLVVSLRQGPIYTYAPRAKGLEPVSQTSDPKLTQLTLRSAADVDGDGQEEMLATGPSQVVLLRLEKGGWLPVWQNFPWGGVSGAALVTLADGPTQVLATSFERMAYLFQKKANGYQMIGKSSDLPFGIAAVLGSVAPSSSSLAKSSPQAKSTRPTTGYVILTRDGLSLRSGLAGPPVWNEVGTSVRTAVLWPVTDLGTTSRTLLTLVTDDGSIVTYAETDASRWKVLFSLAGGRARQLRETAQVAGNLLVSAREVADISGGRLGWNPETKLSTLSLGDIALTFSADGARIERNGEQLTSAPAAVIQGRLYLPLLSLDTLLGWTVDVDPATLSITVTMP